MVERLQDIYRPVDQRRRDFREVERRLSGEEITEQATRCMNCGIPFCHGVGCPLGNVIPEFNQAVARGEWRLAWEILSSTSSFPEFTSRVCPALCEGSCTDGIDSDPVMVRQIERRIVDTAYENGWVAPVVPEHRNGKSVAEVRPDLPRLKNSPGSDSRSRFLKPPGGRADCSVTEFRISNWRRR